uniref:Uncharacterized protein n=2 Tax=Caenorhabditis japonica TaxID=281687 RepID=A0A8R1EA57_CAEJA
ILVFKAPLFFPVSNTSADYVNGDWMDPCYERFYEIGAKYIVYWFVNGDMYCEAVVRGPNINYTATFKQEFLVRAEYKHTWCPPPN